MESVFFKTSLPDGLTQLQQLELSGRKREGIEGIEQETEKEKTKKNFAFICR